MPRTKTTRTSNKEGSIYFNEKRKAWYADIRWKDSAGKEHRKTFSAKKRAAVKIKIDEFKRQLLLDNVSAENNDVTFKEFCEQWMKSSQINKLKPVSYDRKLCTLENQVYPEIGDIPINILSHDDVQTMVNHLRDDKKSYSTIKKAVEAVSGCMRAYRIKTKSQNNPCEGVELPENIKKQAGDIKYFDAEDRRKIKDVANLKYANGKYVFRLGQMIVVLMYTGMRIGELIALKWEDVDFENRTISVNKNAVIVRDRSEDSATHYKLLNQQSTKTGVGRIIPISAIALDALNKLKEINGSFEYVCASKVGTQVSVRNVQRMFAKMLERAGVEHPCKRAAPEDDEEPETSSAGVHILRHTFASMLFQNGCEVKVVSELLGHSNTKTTENIYIHLIQEQKIKAVENLDKYID